MESAALGHPQTHKTHRYDSRTDSPRLPSLRSIIARAWIAEKNGGLFRSRQKRKTQAN